jgi:hypothetical protein
LQPILFKNTYNYCNLLQTIAPYFGYLASLFLIIALLVNNDLKFRWFNTMGNIAFITYAIVIGALPVLLTNCILLCINVYYLWKVYTRKEDFDLLQFQGNEKLAEKFVTFYKADIKNYFPHFDKQSFDGNLNFVVTRDLVIANMFSAVVDSTGDARVNLNYTTPKYRDYKVGTFIFERERDFLQAHGIKRIVYETLPPKKHREFLQVMGFTKAEINGNAQMIKVL